MMLHYYNECEDMFNGYENREKDGTSCDMCGPVEYIGYYDSRIDVQEEHSKFCEIYQENGLFTEDSSKHRNKMLTGHFKYDFICYLDRLQKNLELQDLGFKTIQTAP